MQAVAAEFSGCAENSTAFWREKSLKRAVSIHLFAKPALRQTRFLTRNELVDSAFA